MDTQVIAGANSLAHRNRQSAGVTTPETAHPPATASMSRSLIWAMLAVYQSAKMRINQPHRTTPESVQARRREWRPSRGHDLP
jgi:hypothetical protein